MGYIPILIGVLFDEYRSFDWPKSTLLDELTLKVIRDLKVQKNELKKNVDKYANAIRDAINKMDIVKKPIISIYGRLYDVKLIETEESAIIYNAYLNKFEKDKEIGMGLIIPIDILKDEFKKRDEDIEISTEIIKTNLNAISQILSESNMLKIALGGSIKTNIRVLSIIPINNSLIKILKGDELSPKGFKRFVYEYIVWYLVYLRTFSKKRRTKNQILHELLSNILANLGILAIKVNKNNSIEKQKTATIAHTNLLLYLQIPVREYIFKDDEIIETERTDYTEAYVSYPLNFIDEKTVMIPDFLSDFPDAIIDPFTFTKITIESQHRAEILSWLFATLLFKIEKFREMKASGRFELLNQDQIMDNIKLLIELKNFLENDTSFRGNNIETEKVLMLIDLVLLFFSKFISVPELNVNLAHLESVTKELRDLLVSDDILPKSVIRSLNFLNRYGRDVRRKVDVIKSYLRYMLYSSALRIGSRIYPLLNDISVFKKYDLLELPEIPSYTFIDDKLAGILSRTNRITHRNFDGELRIYNLSERDSYISLYKYGKTFPLRVKFTEFLKDIVNPIILINIRKQSSESTTDIIYEPSAIILLKEALIERILRDKEMKNLLLKDTKIRVTQKKDKMRLVRVVFKRSINLTRGQEKILGNFLEIVNKEFNIFKMTYDEIEKKKHVIKSKYVKSPIYADDPKGLEDAFGSGAVIIITNQV